VSSEVKGESFDDSSAPSPRTPHLIIMSTKARTCGAGGLAPQTLTPIGRFRSSTGVQQRPASHPGAPRRFTLQQSFEYQGGLDGKTVLMCGDLKRGRTVRSLSYTHEKLPWNENHLCCARAFQMKEDVCNFLERHDISYTIENPTVLKRCSVRRTPST